MDAVESTEQGAQLKRSLNLPLLVLYGLGTTIGAGIYVLVGAAAGRAGLYAPAAFVLAAIGTAPAAASYAELAGRYPVSAGEAAYVRAGFNSRTMSLITGWLVIISGTVASATVAIGCAGYIRTFFDIPMPVLITGVIICMGLAAAWGILESVLLAALFTLVEAGGLIALVGAGFVMTPEIVARLPETIPTSGDLSVWSGVAGAGLLAVFAFIGFEDMVNVAEETKNPGRTMPWAIFLTLGITALLYVLVTSVAVLTVPPEELARSRAPLSMVYERLTNTPATVIGGIAVFATLNTILVQIIMASRVVYGMADQGTMPAIFNRVSPVTRTPLHATATIVAACLVLALLIPLERLAELTSQIILGIWALVCLALVLVKLHGEPAPETAFVVGMWVPLCGVATSTVFIIISIVN
jgi:amino acid transporter